MSTPPRHRYTATVAVDFDSTICRHMTLEPLPGALEVLRELQSAGHKLLLNTMRDKELLAEACRFLKDNGVSIAGVGAAPGQHRWTGSRKCYADVYIDDAALGAPLFPLHRRHTQGEGEAERPVYNWQRARKLLALSGLLWDTEALVPVFRGLVPWMCFATRMREAGAARVYIGQDGVSSVYIRCPVCRSLDTATRTAARRERGDAGLAEHRVLECHKCREVSEVSGLIYYPPSALPARAGSHLS